MTNLSVLGHHYAGIVTVPTATLARSLQYETIFDLPLELEVGRS